MEGPMPTEEPETPWNADAQAAFKEYCNYRFQ